MDMNATGKSFTERLSQSGVSREGLIDALCDRFYMNEQAKVVSNGLSTEFAYFLSDLNPARESFREEKISNNINYSATFCDIKELNALLRLPPGKEPDWYETIGLYLYMADECSRLRPGTTFLTEMRKANVSLDGNVPKYSRENLYANVQQMLKNLGMTESHGKIFEEWYKTGHFTIPGERHHDDNEVAGSFHFQVGKLCDYIGSDALSLRSQQALCAAINAHFNPPFEPSITPDNITDENVQNEIKKAIAARYFKAPNKVEAFLNEIKRKMGKDYPLTDYTNPVPNAYTRLARDICCTQDYLPINLAISYALGNKEHMRASPDAEPLSVEEAYHYTNQLTQAGPRKREEVDPRIIDCFTRGNETQKERIRELLQQRHDKEWKEAPPPDNDTNEARKALARGIFSRMPTAALELFYREGYNCAYSDHENISLCYPAVPSPNETSKNHESATISLGLRDSRYGVLYLSNGLDEHKEDKDVKLTQTVMHEIMHMAISYLDKEQKAKLWQKVEAVYKDLIEFQSWQEEMDPDASQKWLGAHPMPPYFNEKLKTMSSYLLLNNTKLDQSLGKVLDTHAFPYQNYADKNKPEEMVCNLAGLMCSEFPYPPKPGERNPYSELKSLGLPALDALARQINESLKIACEQSRKKFPYIEMPEPSVEQSADKMRRA